MIDPSMAALPTRLVKLALCLGLVLASLAAAEAQTTPAAVTAEAVGAAERARFATLVAGDYDAMSRLLGDDLVYTHSTGAVDSKTSYLAPLLAGRTKYVQAEASDGRITLYGTTAVTTGVARVTAHVGTDVRPSVLRYTSVWTLRDGRWQMVAWQATRLP